MTKIVTIMQDPLITETGRIARIVELGDGSLQVQSYGPMSGWKNGGTTFQSMLTAEAVTKEKLAERGLTEQQIDEVLASPDDS